MAWLMKGSHEGATRPTSFDVSKKNSIHSCAPMPPSAFTR